MKFLERLGKLVTVVGGALCLVILGWGMTGCSDRPSVVKPPASTFVADKENVARLCDYFALQSSESLAHAAAQGNVSLYAEKPGIPEDLKNAALEFYKDGLTSNVPKNQEALDQRRNQAISQCSRAGTKWNNPAVSTKK